MPLRRAPLDFLKKICYNIKKKHLFLAQCNFEVNDDGVTTQEKIWTTLIQFAILKIINKKTHLFLVSCAQETSPYAGIEVQIKILGFSSIKKLLAT